MKQVRWLKILRWLCVLPVVVASFAAAFHFSIPFDNWCYDQAVRFGYQTPIEERLPPYLPLSWYGAFAAIVVVLSGSVVAPGHRRAVALALFVMGALIAMTNFGIFSPRATPGGGLSWFKAEEMVGPLVGGALAVACVFIATRRSVARSE